MNARAGPDRSESDELVIQAPTPPARWRKLVPLAALAAFGVAVWVLERTLREVHPREVLEEVSLLPAGRVLASCAFTALAYLSLTGYDALGVHYVGKSLRYPRIALASFIAYGFSNNFAIGGIASTTLRYRLYSAWGLSAREVVRIFVFCSATLWIGYCALAGVVFALVPIDVPRLGEHEFSARLLGIAILSSLIAFSLWSAARRRSIKLAGLELQLPGPRMLFLQVAVSSLDWVFSAAALFALLPATPGLSFAHFLGIYLLAQVIAAISHVPGGIGVFESAILLSITPSPLAADTVLGCLLAFRGIYYLGPLFAAACALVVREVVVRRR